MELRLLELALRIFDPRRWRLRLLQLAGVGAAGGWVWFRSVQHAPVDRAIRDARRAQRRERIRTRTAHLEREHLRP